MRYGCWRRESGTRRSRRRSHARFIEEESKAERRRRKDAERLLETRQLDPWERYRALTDHVAHLLDITELADRKTRFALVILGALNAVNVLIALRAPQFGADALSGLTAPLHRCRTVTLRPTQQVLANLPGRRRDLHRDRRLLPRLHALRRGRARLPAGRGLAPAGA